MGGFLWKLTKRLAKAKREVGEEKITPLLLHPSPLPPLPGIEAFRAREVEALRAAEGLPSLKAPGIRPIAPPPAPAPPIPQAPAPPSPAEEKKEEKEEIERMKFEAIPLKFEEVEEEIEARRRKVEREVMEELKRVNEYVPLISMKWGDRRVTLAWANIRWNDRLKTLVYYLYEPMLSKEEKEALKRLEAWIREKLEIAVGEISSERAFAYLVEKMEEGAKILGIKLRPEQKLKFRYYIYRDFIGLGPIEPLMHDPNLEDISCDGVNVPVFVYHRNPRYGSIPTSIVFASRDELDSFVMRLAQKCGRSISVAEPLLDGSLPTGDRVQATLGTDVAMRGSNFCIKEGYVQLASGEIVDIKELFERCKAEDGSKFDEFGNELVDLSKEMEVIGVNEELEQHKARALRIIKLRAPPKLVRVWIKERGEYCSDIEVTEDHMFHVIGKEGIELIPARELKPGMWIPVPTLIPFRSSTENGEFIEKVKELLKSSNAYIKLSPELRKLIKRCSSKSRLKDIRRGKTKSIPFLEFLENLNSAGKSLECFESLKCLLRKGSRGRGKEVRIPLRLEERLAYLVGWIIGDGNLARENLSIHTGRNKRHFKRVKKAIEEVFGIKGRTYSNELMRIYINSKLIRMFFTHCFSLPVGRKAREVDVPSFIEKADLKIISSFLRGLFEADGDSNYTQLSTSSERLAIKTIFLLARFGIGADLNKCGDVFKVCISTAYQEAFSRYIMKRNSKSRSKKMARKARVIPATLLEPLVRELKCVPKLAKKIWSRKNKLMSFDEALEFSNLLGEQSELSRYFKLLTRGDLEFKQIARVDLVENEEPVYDLQCNPTPFFVGGKQRPLFLHDTVRKFTVLPLTPPAIVQFWTLSPEMFAYLWLAIEHKCSMLISGGTATGKTSLLNAVSLFIRPEMKIVTIEDTPELRLPHPNWIASVARVGFGPGGYGEVTLFDLLKASLRQRPDYVVVGEVRGAEAYVLFQAMATGHCGLGTLHADSIEAVINRLVTKPIELPKAVIQNLDLILFLVLTKVKGKYVRRVERVVEIVGYDFKKDELITNVSFKWDPARDEFIPLKSVLLDRIRFKTGMKQEELKRELVRRAKVIDWLTKNNITDYREVAKYIAMYYTEPEYLEKLISTQSSIK